MDRAEYMRAFSEVERDFEEAVEAFGVPFERAESAPRAGRERAAASCGCHCENGACSLWRTWVSPACVACRTGEETATFFVDLRCTRNCYFCFNPNQENYEHYLSHTRDIVAELEQAHAAGAVFRFLAITGGEPLLHEDQVMAFLRRAQELYPGVHTRLYTSGDGLDERGLRDLAAAGLSEVRFSVKPLDAGSDAGQDRVYALMEQAVPLIPDVVVEVPVIPGTRAEMQGLLRRSDAIGVRGVNLLELCFPLHNAEAFASRGFKLRKHPFKYLYDYWYGGGVPVAGSEAEALELLGFAEREGLGLGVHYCSSDNKNTGQIFQQNKAFFADGTLRAGHPWMRQDDGDRFLKCAKAFGDDASLVREWAEADGSVPYGFDPEAPCIAIPSACAARLRRALPTVELGESVNVVEACGPQGSPSGPPAPPSLRLREVALVPYCPPSLS